MNSIKPIDAEYSTIFSVKIDSIKPINAEYSTIFLVKINAIKPINAEYSTILSQINVIKPLDAEYSRRVTDPKKEGVRGRVRLMRCTSASKKKFISSLPKVEH